MNDMQNFGVRHFKVTKNSLLKRIKKIVLSKKIMILCVISIITIALSITFFSTTVCLKIELDNYDKDNINEKDFKKLDPNINYYYSNNADINISKNIAASSLVGCIENEISVNNLNNTIKNYINDLYNLYSESPNYFSFIYRDIYTGFTVSYNADSPIFTASSIKAPAMIYIYEKASIGEIDLNEELIYDGRFYSDGSGVLKDKNYNTSYTVDTLINYTIHDSDNIAYAMLMNRYGRENIYNYWKDKGTKNIFMYDTIWGTASANDAVIYMEELYKFYVENDEYGSRLMEYFKNAEWKQITDKDGKYNTANKGGWAQSAFHDIAIVFEKNPYILAIYSNTGDNYGDYKYLFDKTSKLVGNLHTEYWKQKMNDCNRIEQY